MKKKSNFIPFYFQKIIFSKWHDMIKKNIKFITTGQFVTFYNTCKGFSSDVRVRDLENQHLDINAKKLSELATIPLGLPYVLIIHGDDEKKADKLLQKYRTVS